MSMQANKRTDFRSLLFVSFLFFYIIFAYSSVVQAPLIGDTLDYFYGFNDSTNNISRYGIEFIIPLIMYVIKAMGLEFEVFLFVTVMLWLPAIFKLANSRDDVLFSAIIYIFFLSPFFFGNAVFLIRQYCGLALVVWSLYAHERNSKLVLLCLSVFCHLSMIILIVMLFKPLRNVITSKRNIVAATILLLLIKVAGIGLSDVIIKGISFILDIGLSVSEIDRKLLFYLGEDGADAALSRTVVGVNVLAIAIYVFRPTVRQVNVDDVFLLMLGSSLLLLLLSDIPILANRAGALSYFFNIPFLVISIWQKRCIVK